MEPLKWKKHLLLVEFGLRDYNSLVSEIHRYAKNNTDRIFHDLLQELDQDCHKARKAFYVIKFIKNEQFYKLPNYRVYDIIDLEKLRNILNSNVYIFDEIWYCKTIYDESNIDISVAGRISFELQYSGYTQIIEQLWNRSPRMIENYNDAVDYIYIRASRQSWGHRYSIDKIHNPKQLTIDLTEIKKQFSNSIIEIERYREKIQIFEDYLACFQYKTFSIEYKIINGRLFIIDWDTPNDWLVLRNM